MTVRFMLLMPWGRVGSNLLVSILRQTRGMKISGEYLNRLRTAEEQLAWLNEHYEIGAAEPSRRFIGSKQNMRALRDADALKRFLKANGLAVVRLRRDNFVKSAVSQMRAAEYAQQAQRENREAGWFLKSGSEPLGPTRIDPELLMERIALMEGAQARLMDAFAPDEVLDVEYEEIRGDVAGVTARMRAHIGLPDTPYEIAHSKFTPDDLKAAIANYEDVARRLAGTPYQAML